MQRSTGRRSSALVILAVLAMLSALVVGVVPTAGAATPTTCEGMAVTIAGTTGDDVLTGTNAADVIHGGDGDDVIRGLNGADYLCGGDGHDTIIGGGGPDVINGGNGFDTMSGDDGDDRLIGGSGDDTMTGGRGNDELLGGAGLDTISGQDGDDILKGDGSKDVLDGGMGNDTIWGGVAADDIRGGPGDDLIFGEGGPDTIYGGDGFDTVDGGPGGYVCYTSEDVTNCKHTFQLTILHNNDGESAVLPDNGFGGAARFVSLVNERKAFAQSPMSLSNTALSGNWIMLSSGDNFLAGPTYTASVADGIWYDARVLDRIGYNGIQLGNHDFDFGPDVLADFIGTGFSMTMPPYLSSNLDFSGEPGLAALTNGSPWMAGDAHRIARSALIMRGSEMIGVVGATTPDLPFISSPRDVVVDPDVAGAIQDEIDVLEAIGVNKIIVISHLQNIGEDLALAPMLSGVDVMIAGGGDELLANADDPLIPGDGPPFGPYPVIATNADGATVPVVTTSGQYFYLGELVVEFDQLGNVVSFDGGPRRVVDIGFAPDGVTPETWTMNKVEKPVADFVADLAANVIATSEVDLDGTRDGVRGMETNEGNLIADSLLWQAQTLAPAFGQPLPDVALQNGGGIRNDSIIPAGDITELDTFAMLPFPNFVSIVPDIPRSQFKEIMENAVSRWPGDGRFAQIAGFSFSWDPDGTAQELDADGNVTTPGTRVVDLMLDDGTVIVDDGVVVAGADIHVATIDFLARGGDQYPFRGAPFTTIGQSYQQALFNYIVGPLGGLITAADYPEGGEGRETNLG